MHWKPSSLGTVRTIELTLHLKCYLHNYFPTSVYCCCPLENYFNIMILSITFVVKDMICVWIYTSTLYCITEVYNVGHRIILFPLFALLALQRKTS